MVEQAVEGVEERYRGELGIGDGERGRRGASPGQLAQCPDDRLGPVGLTLGGALAASPWNRTS